MTKDAWQTAALILASLAVMSMAAAFYNRAELNRVTALLRQAEAKTAPAIASNAELTYINQEPPPAVRARQVDVENQRCIGGVLFGTIDGETRNIGRC